MDIAELDGSWALTIEADLNSAERFSVGSGAVVANAAGSIGRFVLAANRAAATLQDGRTITLCLPAIGPGLYSGTVANQQDGDAPSQPVRWRR